MKPERVTAVFFLAVMVLFASLVTVGFSTKLIKNRSKILPPPPPPKFVDWEKLYPFSDSVTHKSERPSILRRVKDAIGGWEAVLGYYSVVEVERKYEEIIGWNMAAVGYNPVIRLEDGYLATLVASRDISKNAQSLRDFNVFCRENGAELIYINFPTKICKFQDENVADKIDYANRNADRLLMTARGYEVKCYDFREFLHDDGMNHHASFFVTDHHWRPETGLWAAGRILRLLREDYGWEVEPEILRPENFDYVVYRDWFLGSHGRKFTLSRAKPEDISLIYPKFQTLIHCVIPVVDVDASGDFSVIYNMKQVERKDYYHRSPYHAYVYGDQALIRITNTLQNNPKRILLIHDSFSNVVIPFSALGIRYTDAIDPRYFKGSIKSFIISEKPDAVIVCYNSLEIGDVSGISKTLYDFP